MKKETVVASAKSVNQSMQVTWAWLVRPARGTVDQMQQQGSMMQAAQNTTLLALGALWSVVLIVGGALVATRSSEAIASLAPVLACGGITSMIAGQFVFLVVVADRLFPRVQRRLAVAAEIVLAVLLVAGLAATITLLRPGGGSA